MPFRISGLTACPDCDLLQRNPPESAHDIVCTRCGATLYRIVPHALEMTLALMVGACALYLLAITFPVMTLNLHGRETEATLLGMAMAFHDGGMTIVGVAVFLTLVVMPGLEIAAMLYQLVPPRFGIVPPGLALVARMRRSTKPWGMIEVFVLAALVSIGRLEQLADLDLHAAFWALAIMMFLIAMADTIFDERTYWSVIMPGSAHP
jgi:paraquat-inducible protein A